MNGDEAGEVLREIVTDLPVEVIPLFFHAVISRIHGRPQRILVVTRDGEGLLDGTSEIERYDPDVQRRFREALARAEPVLLFLKSLDE